MTLCCKIRSKTWNKFPLIAQQFYLSVFVIQVDNACDCEALNPVWPADLAQKHVCAPAGVWLRFCACLAPVTWYWLVSRALLRSRLWLVSLRPLSSPSSRVLSSWEALSSAFSTEPCANSSACDANHSLCWACSLRQQHTWS